MDTGNDLTVTTAQDQLLSKVLSKIVAAYDPLEVWLFGSRFRGDARPASDWDLLVLLREDAADELFDPYLAWEVSRDCGVRADVVVDVKNDFDRSVGVATSLAREIVNERRRIYVRP